jgi:hypothetical protein
MYLQQDPLSPDSGKKQRLLIFAGSVVAVAILGTLFWFSLSRGPASRSSEGPLPLGPREQAYVPRIEIGSFEMSRAANFLNQEVTYLSGQVANRGDRRVREIEVTIEFRDALNQVVLRDTRRLLGRISDPLALGEQRSFRVSFDHVPADWNVQIPAVRITGLDLE